MEKATKKGTNGKEKGKDKGKEKEKMDKLPKKKIDALVDRGERRESCSSRLELWSFNLDEKVRLKARGISQRPHFADCSPKVFSLPCFSVLPYRCYLPYEYNALLEEGLSQTKMFGKKSCKKSFLVGGSNHNNVFLFKKNVAQSNFFLNETDFVFFLPK
jgi:hypothetical protein